MWLIIRDMIIKRFPSEESSAEYFFKPGLKANSSPLGTATHPSGALINRWKTLKESQRKLPTKKRKADQMETEFPRDPEKYNEAVKFLKDNATAARDVTMNAHWALTSPYRQAEWSQKGLTIDLIFQQWPVLGNSEALRLIKADYNRLKLGDTLLTIENFSKLVDFILNQHRVPAVAVEFEETWQDPNVDKGELNLSNALVVPQCVKRRLFMKRE